MAFAEKFAQVPSQSQEYLYCCQDSAEGSQVVAVVSRGSPAVMHSALSSCPMQEVSPLVVVADMVEYLWILGTAARNSIK